MIVEGYKVGLLERGYLAVGEDEVAERTRVHAVQTRPS